MRANTQYSSCVPQLSPVSREAKRFQIRVGAVHRAAFRRCSTYVPRDSLISVHSAGPSPPYPFDDAWAYYAYSSSHDELDAIRIPFLALNSHDDPTAQCVSQDYDRNEWPRSSSPTEAATWAGSIPVGLRIAGPGAPCSSDSGQREKIYGWSAENKVDRVERRLVGGAWERSSWLSRYWRRLWRPDNGAICWEVYRWMVTEVERASLWSLLNHRSRPLIPKSQSFRCGL